MNSTNTEQNNLPNPNGSLHHEDDNDACLLALQLSFEPLVFNSVLKAAIELNLFEIISKASSRGVSASYVASKLPTTQHPQLPRRLDRNALSSCKSLSSCLFYKHK